MQNNIVIKNFQLRAARSVLGIGVREIGHCLGLSGATISIWEHKGNLENLKTSTDNILLLTEFFKSHNITFPDENSVALREEVKRSSNEEGVLTRFQLRASRIALNMTQVDLANFIGVTRQVISRAEHLRNNEYIRPLEKEASLKIRNWFENNKISYKDCYTISLSDKK